MIRRWTKNILNKRKKFSQRLPDMFYIFPNFFIYFGLSFNILYLNFFQRRYSCNNDNNVKSNCVFRLPANLARKKIYKLISMSSSYIFFFPHQFYRSIIWLFIFLQIEKTKKTFTKSCCLPFSIIFLFKLIKYKKKMAIFFYK